MYVSDPSVTVSAQKPGVDRDEGSEARARNQREGARGAVREAATGLHDDEDREERKGDERELLEEDRGCERNGAGREARAAREGERQHEQEEPGRIGGAEPGAPDRERVRDEQSTEREPPEQRGAKEQDDEEGRERGQRNQEAEVVPRERRVFHPAAATAVPREVREVLRRHVGAPERALEAVEAREPFVAVVVAVRTVAARDDVAGELDPGTSSRS